MVPCHQHSLDSSHKTSTVESLKGRTTPREALTQEVEAVDTGDEHYTEEAKRLKIFLHLTPFKHFLLRPHCFKVCLDPLSCDMCEIRTPTQILTEGNLWSQGFHCN